MRFLFHLRNIQFQEYSKMYHAKMNTYTYSFINNGAIYRLK